MEDVLEKFRYTFYAQLVEWYYFRQTGYAETKRTTNHEYGTNSECNSTCRWTRSSWKRYQHELAGLKRTLRMTLQKVKRTQNLFRKPQETQPPWTLMAEAQSEGDFDIRVRTYIQRISMIVSLLSLLADHAKGGIIWHWRAWNGNDYCQHQWLLKLNNDADERHWRREMMCNHHLRHLLITLCRPQCSCNLLMLPVRVPVCQLRIFWYLPSTQHLYRDIRACSTC